MTAAEFAEKSHARRKEKGAAVGAVMMRKTDKPLLAPVTAKFRRREG